MAASLMACGGAKSEAAGAAESAETGETGAAQTAAAAAEDSSAPAEDDSAEESASAAAAEVDIPEAPYVRDDGGVSMDVFAMDTYMNLLAYGDRAEEAVLAAAKEIHRIDDMLSTGNPDSEISKLNAAGTGQVSEDTLHLIKESQTLYEDTGGLFDIAIYPIMQLWGFPTQQYRVPTEEEIKKALKLADASKIAIGATTVPEPAAAEPAAAAEAAEAGTAEKAEETEKAAAAEDAKSAEKDAAAEDAKAAEGDNAAETAAADSTASEAAAPEGSTAAAEKPAAAGEPAAEAAQETAAADNSAKTLVLFGVSDMEIDLGGIAKGFTSSRVMEVFKEYGIEHGLVSLGGNVQALGSKENGNPWRVAIQNPESELDYLGILDIENKCVITSGGYERFFERDGIRYHHIIDPRTGYPADSGIISATIISEDGTLADGLSTSLFIMGKDQAEKFWRKNADRFDYVIEDKDGKLYVTEGAANMLTTEAEMEIVTK